MCLSASIVYVIHQRATFADIESSDLNAKRYLYFVANTITIFGLRVLVFEQLISIHFRQSVALFIALASSFFINYGISRVLIFGRSSGKP